MNRKQELTVLFFLTLFLLVMLISNIARYITEPGEANVLMIVCFAGGLICTIISWVQYFRGRNKDEE